MNDEVLFENPRYVRRNNALNNPTWLPPQHAVAPLKRASAGTGVFLPRRYPTTSSSDSLKKPGTVSSQVFVWVWVSVLRYVLTLSCISVTVNTPAMLQAKVNPQNLNFDEFTNVGPRHSQFDYGNYSIIRKLVLIKRKSSEFNSYVFIIWAECMFARSLLQARQGNFRAVGGGGGCLNQERRLPQDWMYWWWWSCSCCFCLKSLNIRSVLVFEVVWV